MKNVVNSCVKFREGFRPFAPSVLEEFQKDYFKMDQSSPYMLLITEVKKEIKNIIPVVVHVDGTARPQTVCKEADPLFWELINEFYKLTGVPVLLNTSFNIRDEPIVCTPDQAISCFLKSGLDVLVLGKYLIKR